MNFLRLRLGLFLFLAMLTLPTWAEERAVPFRLKLLNPPAAVQAGKTYKLAIEIKNIGQTPLTLCLLPGFTRSWAWRGRSGFLIGTYQSGIYKTITGTSYDPITQTFHCKTLSYAKNDFITIPAASRHQVDLTVEVPKEWNSTKIKLDLRLVSNYDGSELGFNGWTGESDLLKLSFLRGKKDDIAR